MRYFTAVLCAVLLSNLGLPARAATTGLVHGVITLDGTAKSGVALKLAGEGSAFTTISDSHGAYAFAQVPFGHYLLTAHFDGIKDETTELEVASDTSQTVDLALSTTAVKTIVVTSSRGAHGGVGGTPVGVNTLSRTQIAALPINNSLNGIVQTFPGIVKFSYNEPVAHGFHGVSYEIDGAPFPQSTSSNFAEIIDPKNVDSVEVFTGAMPAEYGGSRQGAVINIITQRPTDLSAPFEGQATYGFGNYGQAVGSLDAATKLGASELFLMTNAQHTDRGLDAPTFTPNHDNASQSDAFLRFVTPLGARATLGFDYSNQLAQFQIPINTDPHNPNDPVLSVPGTDDVQRDYDRYVNLNFTSVSRDGNDVFQIIPWYRSTRVDYAGDLAKDVLATQPDPNTGLPINLVGLVENRQANYVGLRVSDLRSSDDNTVKVGVDLSRENFQSADTFAQFGLPNVTTFVTRPGSQIGAYVQDNWQPSKAVSVQGGLRYDHSTGFVSGNQISPRIGINVQADSKNLLHAYYGRFYAAPQLEDVRESCVVLSGGCGTTPVYDLKPETDSYWELGVRHQFNSTLSGYVNYFMRNVNNVLDTTQLLNTPIFAVFNNTLGRDRGVEFRLDDALPHGDAWFFSGTVSDSEAAGVSGSTFLFPPGTSSAGIFQPEDHDQTYEANAAYTHRFGTDRSWFATLQGEYGSGFPVQFQNGTGRLPVHTTLDLALGKNLDSGSHKTLGFDLDVNNLLNHQYVIKIANGFNTTQISSGRNILFRLTAPL